MNIICGLLYLYIVILVFRAVLSWFPPPRSAFMATVSEFLYAITEPLLAPLRRVIPPMGGFDLSFLVLMFGILILRGVLC